jgi:hypothetical protein
MLDGHRITWSRVMHTDRTATRSTYCLECSCGLRVHDQALHELELIGLYHRLNELELMVDTLLARPRDDGQPAQNSRRLLLGTFVRKVAY